MRAKSGMKPEMTTYPYLVAGGGIAGLAAALGLAGTGADVRLFEQAAGFTEVGAGLQMSPNGVRALQALGAWEAVAPACVVPSEIHVKDGVTGSLLQRVRLGKSFEERFGAPYRVCHRADLLGGLLATARQSERIALFNRRTAIAADPSEARIHFAEGGSEAGRAIIGADGIRSRLRKAVCGEVAPSSFGHIIFRSLIPLRDVPPEINADCVTLWLCPGGHVVHYAVSNWRNFNIVAAVDGEGTADGWETPARRSELMAHFPRACEELAALLDAVAGWRRWPGADLPSLPRWHKDKLILLGDAAHATLPYLAQGAVMSLEDAVVLARELHTAAMPEAAFAKVENLRRARTSAVQQQSRRMGRIYHASGPTALARNMALRLGGSAMLMRQTAWLYDWTP